MLCLKRMDLKFQAQALVMVSARPMDMAVVAFLIGRGTHFANLDVEVERHAGQRMIAVNGHLVADNLGDDDCLLAELTLGMELHSFLKLLAALDLIGGNDGNILGIVNAVSFFGRNANLEGIAGLLALHRLFKARNDLPFALDIGQRFAANRGVDDILVVVGEGVVENNYGAGGDLHKRSGCVARRIPHAAR